MKKLITMLLLGAATMSAAATEMTGLETTGKAMTEQEMTGQASTEQEMTGKATTEQEMTGQVERPKLVVGIVVDQMRWDYLYYYHDEFVEGGLKRLLDEGFSYENCMINYIPTVTAIGHSSVYTGSVPSLTGIAGNSFYIDGKETTSVRDTTVQTVGAPNGRPGQRSPHNLLATTIGDQLKTATDFRAKVFGVALKDRAAILPAGHCADAAYWWDENAGHYVTSTYYMNQLPRWMEDFNKTHNTKPHYDIKTSSEGVTMTFDLASAVLENEQLGQDDITDLLAISVSSTDAIGHAYGTRGEENHSVYMQLDKDLAQFLSLLDKKVGRGNYLLFLTADHGALHAPKFLREHKMPNGGWKNDEARKQLNTELSKTFGSNQLVSAIMDCRVYLNHDEIAAKGLDINAIKEKAIEFLRQDKDLAYVADYDRLSEASIPAPIKERAINGYNRLRSGDIFVQVKAGLLNYAFKDSFTGTSHGQWNPYDSHIPMVFMGWHVPQGSSTRETHITDFAATVCAMLHIERPDCCIGEALEMK